MIHRIHLIILFYVKDIMLTNLFIFLSFLIFQQTGGCEGG